MYLPTCDLHRFCFVCIIWCQINIIKRMPETKTAWNKSIEGLQSWSAKKQGNWSQGVNVLSGSAIFWKLDFSVWKWSTPIWQVGARVIISAKAHGNREVLADLGGAWKWTSKPGKKTDTHPLRIQDPHVKTRVHQFESKDTENLRAYTHNFHTSLSTLSLLVWGKTSHAPPLPYQASHHLSLTLQAFQDATVPHIRLVCCLLFGVNVTRNLRPPRTKLLRRQAKSLQPEQHSFGVMGFADFPWCDENCAKSTQATYAVYTV